ncbi:MAG: aspartyl protease family protein, partial [Acidobacteriota bacterium]|nr:aspartyl protease family protein [Acidobacteriota bacterium]
MKFFRPLVRLTLYAALLLSACASAQKQETVSTTAPASAQSKPVASLRGETLLGGGLLLQARVNDSGPLWFILDSGGGPGFVVDARRARTYGLELHGRLTSTGAGENSFTITFANNTRIALAGVEFPAQTVRVFSLNSLEPFAGRSLDGLIGFGLFTRYVVEIDYDSGRINLYDPRTYRYDGPGTILPLAIEGDHFYLKAKVQMPGREAVEGKFMIDTGAVMTAIALNRPFVEKNNLLPAGEKILDRGALGLGGESRHILSRAAMLQLGGMTIKEPTVTLSQDAGGALASTNFDGIIGDELLRRFKVIFDASRRELILEANEHFREPYEHNMSGLSLRAEGPEF